MASAHEVFVSFHHQNDEGYKRLFCDRMGPNIVDKSVEDGDINLNVQTETVRQRIRDDFIADATVVVVLIGTCTWQRKHVDWEIGSGLRDTKLNSRCGLLGILLPSHLDFYRDTCRRKLIPPRLADNCSGDDPFASIRDWPEPWDATLVQRWIDNAFRRRFGDPAPRNGRPQFKRNKSGPCSDGWSE